MDDVAEGARGKRALRAGELGLAGSGGVVGIAVGQPVGAGFGEAHGGVEVEGKAFESGGRGGGQVEFVGGIEDTKICGTNPGLRIETCHPSEQRPLAGDPVWGTQILGGGEVGLGGGPGSLQQAGGVGMDLAIGGELGRGEEVQFLAGAGAGDVKEALALGCLAGAMDSVKPVVERLRRLAAAGDGGEHEVCRRFGGGVQTVRVRTM